MARQFDADFQALVASKFAVIIAIRLLCFGEAGETPGLFFHSVIIGETRPVSKPNHQAGTEWIDGRGALGFHPQRMTDRTRGARQGTVLVSRE